MLFKRSKILLFINIILQLQFGYASPQDAIEISLSMHRSDERLPNISFIPLKPGDEVFPVKEEVSGVPDTLKIIQIDHEFLDRDQFLFQTMRAGIVSRERYNKFFATMDTSALTSDWIDCIFSCIIARDNRDSLVVIVDTDNDESFSDENELIFQYGDLTYIDKTEKIMQAFVNVQFDYYENGKIKTHTLPIRIFYFLKKGPVELYWSVDAYRLGRWSVGQTTYDVALWNPSGTYRPSRYLFLYIDLDKNGFFDLMPDGIEAYPLTSMFSIEGSTWRIDQLKVDGSMIRIVKSDSIVAPLTALRKGTPAPNFEGITLDGKKISLRDFRGRYVLLDFWGPWCGPCLKEIPYLKTAYKAFGNSKLSIIGICFTSNENAARYAVKKYEISWPQIFQERDGEIHKAYRIVSWPSQWLINPEGIIVETGMALRRDSLMVTLNKYLKNKESVLK